MNWILYGFKSAGKTYFSKKLGLPHIDTDQKIEEKVGRSIQEIVLEMGETHFRRIEREVIAALDVQGHLISVGGGTVLDTKNVVHLQSLGTLIYLRCPKEILKTRLLASPPTYFDLKDLEGSFEKIYSQRIPIYEKIASHTVDVTSDKETLETLWQAIKLATSSASPLGGNPTAKPSAL